MVLTRKKEQMHIAFVPFFQIILLWALYLLHLGLENKRVWLVTSSLAKPSSFLDHLAAGFRPSLPYNLDDHSYVHLVY